MSLNARHYNEERNGNADHGAGKDSGKAHHDCEPFLQDI